MKCEVLLGEVHSIQITLWVVRLPGWWTQLVIRARFWSDLFWNRKFGTGVPFLLNQMEQEPADKGGPNYGNRLELASCCYRIAGSWNWTLGLVPNPFENPNWMEIYLFLIWF